LLSKPLWESAVCADFHQWRACLFDHECLTAPKPSDCISGGAQEIFSGVSEDFLGGDGKAEGAKVPGAGIWPEAVPRKMSSKKRLAY